MKRFRFAIALAATVFVSMIAKVQAEELWLEFEGGEGPGAGKHIVLVSGDDEYRSEEAMPMMAKILSERLGFHCTVLFAIDPESGEIKPDYQKNIPGLESLEDADLMVLFTRFRDLPDSQMKYIVDFMNSGKPMIGLRTATHAFNLSKESAFKHLSWNSKSPQGGFGQEVFGDTWISHHGKHKSESTRGVIDESSLESPILTGVKDVWGPSDVYGIVHLPDEAQVLLRGQILSGMEPNDAPVDDQRNKPMMPLAWTKSYESESGKVSRVFCTTMGASLDFESADLRRLMVNAIFWGLEMEDAISADFNVDIVGEYEPLMYGFKTYAKGKVPADYR